MCSGSVGDHDLNHELKQREQRDNIGAACFGNMIKMSNASLCHVMSCHVMSCHVMYVSLGESRAVHATLLELCDPGRPCLIFVVIHTHV